MDTHPKGFTNSSGVLAVDLTNYSGYLELSGNICEFYVSFSDVNQISPDTATPTWLQNLLMGKRSLVTYTKDLSAGS